ncbi:hypothetical protein ACFSL6_02595 [Paenibacillus thailandensis]|uniref:Uncharacterized protein n=1 Tax=Paenibacillus thailandensis TaxID=393250 RepID=A0ABW5QUJ7_9BACL
MNIMDGMDAARFNSGNPHEKSKEEETNEANAEANAKMPMVLRNLNNKSDFDRTNPQQAKE